jgi:DNA-binding HxlR family transcriptional regulator
METAARSSALDGAANEEVCPYYHEAVELVGKRWTGAIVGALMPAPRRFSQIAHAIPQISDRLLSSRLRELEAKGLVARQVLPGAPIRVQYALTPKGRALEPVVSALSLWARQWLSLRGDATQPERSDDFTLA